MQKNSDQAINLTPQSSKKRRESDDESVREAVRYSKNSTHQNINCYVQAFLCKSE